MGIPNLSGYTQTNGVQLNQGTQGTSGSSGAVVEDKNATVKYDIPPKQPPKVTSGQVAGGSGASTGSAANVDAAPLNGSNSTSGVQNGSGSGGDVNRKYEGTNISYNPNAWPGNETKVTLDKYENGIGLRITYDFKLSGNAGTFANSAENTYAYSEFKEIFSTLADDVKKLKSYKAFEKAKKNNKGLKAAEEALAKELNELIKNKLFETRMLDGLSGISVAVIVLGITVSVGNV